MRALRRHHYLRKIKRQQLNMKEIKERQAGGRNSQVGLAEISNHMMELKKARLVEEGMSYEELIMEQNFSEDEVTFTLNRRLVKEKKELMCLHQVKRMERQTLELMEETAKGMQAMIETIHSIDENCKKILYKEFEEKNVNILARYVPHITRRI